MHSLRRNVNIGITSRRDPLINKIANCHDTRYYVIRKISKSCRDVVLRQCVISLFSDSNIYRETVRTGGYLVALDIPAYFS